MSSYGVRDWQREAQRYEGTLEGQLAMVRARAAEHLATRDILRGRIAPALHELCAALLPELTLDALKKAVELSSYRTLEQEDPIGAMERRREELLARIAEIEAEPRYVQREALRHPVTGTLTLELEEQLQHQRPLAAFLDRVAHPRLERLLEVGYGTEQYDVGWWRLSYYGDWKAGDEILERFEQDKRYETFGPLREAIIDMREAKGTYDAEIARIETDIAAGKALEEELLASQEALEGLAATFLARSREKLARYLDEAGPGILGERLTSEPGIEGLAKRWAGLREQVTYLDALQRAQLDEQERRLGEELRKIRRKQLKYMRPKKSGTRFTPSDFQRQFKDRTPKYRKFWKRYDRRFDAVSRFDRYERGSLASDVLWWDVMTDGRLDGSFIPQVERFHRAHPGYQYERPSDDAYAAAAVAEAEALGTDDGGGLFDPS